MQHIIVIINTLGYRKTSEKFSSRDYALGLINDFESMSKYIKLNHNEVIRIEDIFCETNRLAAEEVIQFFCNVDYKKMGTLQSIYKTSKEIALSYYITDKEIGSLCFMYNSYKRRFTYLKAVV